MQNEQSTLNKKNLFEKESICYVWEKFITTKLNYKPGYKNTTCHLLDTISLYKFHMITISDIRYCQSIPLLRLIYINI